MCPVHIGMVIRQKRREKNFSAEYVAQHLERPISKQAFAKKERTGHFSYQLVLEIARLLECNLSDLVAETSQSAADKPP